MLRVRVGGAHSIQLHKFISNLIGLLYMIKWPSHTVKTKSIYLHHVLRYRLFLDDTTILKYLHYETNSLKVIKYHQKTSISLYVVHRQLNRQWTKHPAIKLAEVIMDGWTDE